MLERVPLLVTALREIPTVPSVNLTPPGHTPTLHDHLSKNLSQPKTLAAWPIEPLPQGHEVVVRGSVDPDTGKLLLDTGFIAGSVSDPSERVVSFSRDGYCPLVSCDVRPYYEDEPIAGFWLGGRGVIVTRGAKVGIVVVDR